MQRRHNLCRPKGHVDVPRKDESASVKLHLEQLKTFALFWHTRTESVTNCAVIIGASRHGQGRAF